MDALAKLPNSIRSLNNNSNVPIPITTTAAAATATVVVAAPILATYWYRSYRAFVSLGPGGLPASMKGWLMQCLMRPFARYDIRVPAPWSDESLGSLSWILGGEKGLWWSGGGKKYDGDEARICYILPSPSSPASSKRSGMATLGLGGGGRIPPRSGGTAGRPQTTSVVVPQRQLSQTVHENRKTEAEKRILDRMDRFLLRLADQNPTLFEIRTSVLERHGSGVFVRGDFEVEVDGAAMTVDERMGNGGGAREFFHVHHGDGGSSHIILSLTDAATAISARWAERHMMSGTFLLPWGYVMVYTPRDEGELAVWRELVLASARYVVGDVEGRMVVAPEV